MVIFSFGTCFSIWSHFITSCQWGMSNHNHFPKNWRSRVAPKMESLPPRREINYYYYLINGSSALSAGFSEEMFAETCHHCECCLCFDFLQGFHLGRMDLKSGSEPQLPILLISFLNVYPCLAFATLNQYPGWLPSETVVYTKLFWTVLAKGFTSSFFLILECCEGVYKIYTFKTLWSPTYIFVNKSQTWLYIHLCNYVWSTLPDQVSKFSFHVFFFFPGPIFFHYGGLRHC